MNQGKELMMAEFREHRLRVRTVRIPPRDEWKQQAESWRLCWLKRGRGTLTDGQCLYSLRGGDLAMLPAGTHSLIKADPDSDVSLHYLAFPAVAMERSLSLGARLVFRQAANSSQSPTILSGPSRLSRRVKDLFEHAFPGEDEDWKATSEGNGSATLFEELTEVFVQLNHLMDGTAGRMFATLRSIDESELQKLSISDLARRCGCSRRHLSRMIRDHCDCSLASIRLELRLDKAARILRATNDKIIDVAMDCGFNHLGSFTSRFKRRFGMTPGEWRKMLRESRIFSETSTGSQKMPSCSVGLRFQSR